MTGKKLKYLFEYCREYGFRCLIALVLSSLFPYSGNGSQWRKRILKYQHRVIVDYLDRHYYSRSYSSCSQQDCQPDTEDSDYCIWTAWLQGEENAPEVIRLTLASIRENAGGHSVVVLTENNIEQYIEVPAAIKRKHENGTMRHAHFADVVRMKILEKYGGIWLDATTLLYEPINENAFSSAFYSVGFMTKNERFITESRWIVRLIGGCRDSRYLSMISRMLSMYWEEHILPIDYFAFDYLIYLVYRNDRQFRSIVDQLPQMEMPTNMLRDVMNERFSRKQLNGIMTNHQMYTLSYKYDYRTRTPDGDRTNYDYLLERYLKRNDRGVQNRQ